MQELEPYSGVYVYPEHVTRVLLMKSKADQTASGWGACVARYLLGVFWPTSELVHATLSLVPKPGQTTLAPPIIDAIYSKL